MMDNVCDFIHQCSDGSDEDPHMCRQGQSDTSYDTCHQGHSDGSDKDDPHMCDQGKSVVIKILTCVTRVSQ